MRNRMIAAALIGVLIAAPVLAADGLRLLPESTEGVLTVANMTELYSKLGVTDLRAERPEDFGVFSDEIMEYVGVDLLDPVAMKAEGFEIDRPLHVGILADPPAVVVLIPGTNNALIWVIARMELLGVHFSREERINGVTVSGGDADEVACFHDRDYVAVVITDYGEGGGSAMTTADALLRAGREGAITASESYQKTMKRLPPGADATVYAGPDLRTRLSKWGSSRRDLTEYGLSDDDMQSWERELGIDGLASGHALRLAPDGLTVNGFSWLPEDSRARNWMIVDNDPVAFLRRAPLQPWLAAITRLDAGALWDMLSTFFDRVNEDENESIDDVFAEIKAETGLDVESDLIRQISGNLGLLVSRVSFVGSDIVVLIQVRDPGRFQKTIGAVTDLIREDIEKKSQENPEKAPAQLRDDVLGGVEVHCVSPSPAVEVCYGLVEDHLVVTTLPQRFTEIAQGKSGLIASIDNPAVRDALSDPAGGALYIDFRGLSRDAEVLLPMLGPKGVTIAQLLAELSGLAVTSRIDDEGVTQTVTFSSTRPGIWKYLVDLLLTEAARVQVD